MRMLSLGVRTRMCLQSPDTDMSSVLNFAVLLLVACLARGQLDCAYPTRTDLASVIQNTLRSGDAEGAGSASAIDYVCICAHAYTSRRWSGVSRARALASSAARVILTPAQ